MKQFELTKEGIKNLENELDNLINVKRPEITRQLVAAREQGDLSENADYDAAKNAQGEIETRISEIQEMLRNAIVVNEGKSDTIVMIGSTVELENVKNGKKLVYHIVGEIEANPEENKISNLCPVAKAIIGHKKGETVEIINIANPYHVKIVKIN